jgi:hypothetical protein
MRSLLASIGVLGCLALLGGASATAQDFSGTYRLNAGGGTAITVTLRQARNGQVTGTLQGKTSFRIQARMRGGTFSGYASNPSGRIHLRGQLAGGQLQLAMAEVGADGQPQLGTTRTVLMERVTPPGRAPASRADKTAPLAQAPRAAARPADPFAGTFVGDGIALTLARSGAGYAGSATSEGERYRVRAQLSGSILSGVYEGGGGQLPFQAMVQGDVMRLAAGGETYTLRRQGGDAGRRLAAGGPGGAGATATTPQERPIAQLLVRSEWCTMTYSGIVGSTTGTTRYERLVFRPDGTGTRRTSSESYYSNDAGAAAADGSGASQFRWRLDGSVLVSSTDGGASWVRAPMRISTNSNGYPIITANGKDYAMCN